MGEKCRPYNYLASNRAYFVSIIINEQCPRLQIAVHRLASHCGLYSTALSRPDLG